ncbi:putative sugar O-methyltransferase [Bradyrhizobium lablabi]|uniref:putative sugar O-methyltransferase n=1 Tax=Bradyrhizobium lablabi TaxID=722472 RepID=UPI001BA5AA3E|nr:putative sugar O-methyltransferase [Bradyrhizobium lablabi]MBR1120194.1 putative sugar O-methyltransferase [Bradyrhizobium lablabi]
MKRQVRQILESHFPGVLQGLRSAMKAPTIRYRYHRRPYSLNATSGYATGETGDDRNLIDRLIASYNARRENPSGQWSEIFLERHADIRDAFASNDRAKIEEILRNPVTSDIFFGFDSTGKTLRAGGLRLEDRHAPALVLDALVVFAEALGVRNLEHPENYYFWRRERYEPDELLAQIDKALGFTIPVPNPYPREYGLITGRGIVSYRVPQALYQAWRISRLVAGLKNPKVLEIGGGLGRTAFYARQFGVRDYTIVDIPVSSLAQGYFLGRTLGDESVALFGESSADDRIKLMPPGHFLEGTQRYDLIVNVDSLTEIGREAAEGYFAQVASRSDVFLSINHEANEFTVAQLIAQMAPGRHGTRMPYWMRRGFVEEVVDFRQ